MRDGVEANGGGAAQGLRAFIVGRTAKAVGPRLKRTAAAAACFEPATARFGTPGANASVGRMRCGSPRGLSAPVGSAGRAPDRRDPIPGMGDWT